MLRSSFLVVLLTSLVLLLLIPRSYCSEINVTQTYTCPKSEYALVEFPLNVVDLVAEYFCMGAKGYGLDAFAPGLAQGGPPPIGGQKANLDPLTKDFALQSCLVAIGHLRAMNRVVKGFPRPLINLKKDLFAHIVNQALGQHLHPPFDPYANSMNFRIGTYMITEAGPNIFVGTIPKLQNTESKEVFAGILGAASGSATSNRAYLYERWDSPVPPYKVTVGELTNRIAELANKLGMEGTKSEGIVVPPWLGAEGRVSGNVIEGDKYSLSYGKTPEEVLRIFYASGSERIPGGFFPHGANGRIAKYYLNLP